MSNFSFGQKNHKQIKSLRDSIFNVMQLTEENRLKMHELIAENSKGQKSIKEDETLTDEQRNEKLKLWKNNYLAKEKLILTPDQFQIWRNFGKSLINNPKQ